MIACVNSFLILVVEPGAEATTPMGADDSKKSVLMNLDGIRVDENSLFCFLWLNSGIPSWPWTSRARNVIRGCGSHGPHTDEAFAAKLAAVRFVSMKTPCKIPRPPANLRLQTGMLRHAAVNDDEVAREPFLCRP